MDVLPCQCAQLTTLSVLSVAEDFAVITLLTTLSAPLAARKIVVTLPDLVLSLAGWFFLFDFVLGVTFFLLVVTDLCRVQPLWFLLPRNTYLGQNARPGERAAFCRPWSVGLCEGSEC